MKFIFANNKEVKSLDAVPPEYHGLYVQEGEGHKLNTDDPQVGGAIAVLVKVDTALHAERTAHAATKAKATSVDLSSLSDYGATVEEIAEGIKAKLSDAGKGTKTDKEVIAQHVRNAQDAMALTHGKELKAHEDRNGALQKRLYTELVTNKANTALVDAGIIDADLARPHLVNNVKVTEVEGEFSVNVVDTSGEVRYSGTTAQPMTIAERVAEMKGEEKFKPLFKSDAKPGGGKRPGGPPTKPAGKTGDMSATEKIQAGLNKGQATKAGGS